MPKPGSVNAAFTVEGDKAYEFVQDFLTWIKGKEEEDNLTIKHLRHDFFPLYSRINPKEPSEAKQFETNGKPVPAFKGGKDVRAA